MPTVSSGGSPRGGTRPDGDAVASGSVAAPDLGTWTPLGLEGVIKRFSPAPFRWWIGGGRALDLHLGRSWRDHGDTDVGVVRSDLRSVYALLSDWDLHVAAAGHLKAWHGEPLDAALHENNVWCRFAPDGPWVLDVTIGDGSDTRWIYRRDMSVQVPWDLAVLWTVEGVPYLAPELQLLFKSEDLRPKDDLDAGEVVPELDARRRSELSRLLAADHPWQRLLGATQESRGGADGLSDDKVVRPMSSVGVLRAMLVMFASGDPSDAAAVVADEYLDHQGLGIGPIRGIDGFAMVVRTSHVAYEHQEISIEDLFGVDDRAVARIRWRGQRHDGAVVDRETIDIIRVADGRPWSTGGHAPELMSPLLAHE